ncbi:hypothetical protein RSJ22_17695 [Clostridium botulinum]|uniref:hypothetical protein n=1 Tax=Clostridium botulinum TaxID=1491 RepID=UPI000772DE77|nr:hypothetical protein [Clostridium botulinum]AUN23175.1 hypothetical protein RSJ22_17695 [Clostridium botulinum]
MRKIIILLIILLELCTVLCGCSTKYESAGEVEATVTSKEYRESNITMIPMTISNGKTITITMSPQINPEKYKVKLKYKDIITIIDDKKVYESVQTGDKIKVNHYILSDKKKEKISYGGK